MAVPMIAPAAWPATLAPDPESGAELAALLRSLRIAAGLSQNQLAKSAGIDAAYVNRLERNVQRPDGTGSTMPSRGVIRVLWSALSSDQDVTLLDDMLAAAGYLPESIRLDGGWSIARTLWQSSIAALERKLDLSRSETARLAAEVVRLRRAERIGTLRVERLS